MIYSYRLKISADFYRKLFKVLWNCQWMKMAHQTGLENSRKSGNFETVIEWRPWLSVSMEK